jgi:hypothetical protein
MKMPNFYRLTSIVIVLSLMLSACQRKWKKTAPSIFSVNVHKVQDVPAITITNGIIVVDKFEFEGKRKQGNDVYFNNESENLSRIDIGTSAFLTPLNYDIPQGTYTEIRCNLRFRSDDSNVPSMRIEGTFLNSSSQLIPFIFETEDYIPVEISATGIEETFVEDDEIRPVIHLNVNRWFSAITNNQLDNADTTVINSVPTILLDEDNNSDLYELVISRIGTIESLEFD